MSTIFKQGDVVFDTANKTFPTVVLVDGSTVCLRVPPVGVNKQTYWRWIDKIVPVLQPGDRVVYEGLLPSLKGKAGVITKYSYMQAESYEHVGVAFDHEPGRARVTNRINLRPEETTMNIKQTVIDIVKGAGPTSTRKGMAQLAFELLCAGAAATAAEARKKKAKQAAIDGGLVLAEYRPGEVTSYDDAEFTVVAKTKEPTSKLDQTLLRAALSRAGLSRAKIDAAFVAATTENKPATSYEVIQK